MREINYDWQKVERAVSNIAMDMYESAWRPDYIVGITRGGLVPAVMLSHMTGIPMHTLCVQLSSDALDENTESNLWMAEDAYGYDATYKDNYYQRPAKVKNILIIDDINRGGSAAEWIMDDWRSGCLPDSPKWDDVFHGNVRFAVLVDHLNSSEPSDYCSEEIGDEEVWINFPWER